MVRSRFLLIAFLALFCCRAIGQNPSFQKGINLSTWLQGTSVKNTPFNRYTADDFKVFKHIGIDVVRLPINFSAMSSGKPDYKIPQLLFEFIDSAITWSETEGIHLILDNHSYLPSKLSHSELRKELHMLWSQLSLRYSNSYDNLYFEILNEPHSIDAEVWGEIQRCVITEIRKYDTTHFIVVTPSEYAHAKGLSKLPEYVDPKLLYTFHFYYPFLFTHQGVPFTSPSFESLEALPFPYDASKMPSLPESIVGTWAETKFSRDYSSEATHESLTNQIGLVTDFVKTTGKPVFCGEFGVYRETALQKDRVAWYASVTNSLSNNDIPWTMWNYRGGFGLFTKNSTESIPEDFNDELMDVLGFSSSSIKPLHHEQDFIVYADILNRLVLNKSIMDEKQLDLFCSQNPYVGRYCIQVKDLKRYQPILFQFEQAIDATVLNALDFYFLSNDDRVSFEIMLSEEDGKEFTVHFQGNELVNNGQWQKVSVSLALFREKGVWVNGTWQTPSKTSRIRRISMLTLVNNQKTLNATTFYIDEMKLRK